MKPFILNGEPLAHRTLDLEDFILIILMAEGREPASLLVIFKSQTQSISLLVNLLDLALVELILRTLTIQLLKCIQVLLVNYWVHAVANCVVSLNSLMTCLATHQEVPADHVDVIIVHFDLVVRVINLEGEGGRGGINVCLIHDLPSELWYTLVQVCHDQ